MSITKRLERFISNKKPLWVILWLLFPVAFGYAFNFFVVAEEELAETAATFAEHQRQWAERKQIGQVSEAIDKALRPAVALQTFYVRQVAVPPGQGLSAETIRVGQELSRTARQEVSSAIGVLDGTSFADAQLAGYLNGFKQFLSKLQRDDSRIAEFFLMASRKQGQRPKPVEPSTFVDVGNIAEVFTTYQGWSETSAALLLQDRRQNDVLLAKLNGFRHRLWIAFGCATYCTTVLWNTLLVVFPRKRP